MPTSQTNRPASKTRYEYKPPKAEMRATKPNPILEGISSGLGSFREFVNKLGDAAFLPPPQGVPGVGDMLTGTAPEEVHEWASGFSPFSEEPNLGNRLDPRIKSGREQGVMDVGFLGADVGGLGLAALRKGARAIAPTVNPELDLSRRKFMGDTGKIAAGTAAAAVVPTVLRVGEHTTPRIAEHAAPTVVRHAAAAATRATPHEFFGAVNSANRISKAHYEAVLAKEYDRRFAEAVKEGRINREQGINTPHDKNSDVLEEIYNEAEGEALIKSSEVNQRLRDQIKNDPKYSGYSTIEDKLNSLGDNAAEIRYDTAIEDWKRQHGILSDDQILAKLKSGEKYIDPQTGHEAVLNKHGEIEYRDVETGEQRRYAHWIPENRGKPKYFPEEHGVFDEEFSHPSDTYNKHMKFTRDEEISRSREEQEKYFRNVIEDEKKNGYEGLDQEEIDLLRELEEQLNRNKGKAAGGSVTMPDNYRHGGRVRMI